MQDSEYRTDDAGFRKQDKLCRIRNTGKMIQDSEYRIDDPEFRL